MADERMTYTMTPTDRTSNGLALERLVEIMAQLRSPDGCPWDREQTLESIRPYLIEEAFEVLEAIDDNDVGEHRKELGDLLLQIVFQARLREEKGEFKFADVAHAISDKLVSRHPHVFGDTKVANADEVLTNWAKLKEQERRAAGQENPSALDGVPRALPALVRAERIGEKASRVGFDWPDLVQVRQKVDEELRELDQALASKDATQIEDELGDVLFSMCQFARFANVHPEDALRASAAKFERRFRWMEQAARDRGTELRALDAPSLDTLWNEAKAALR